MIRQHKESKYYEDWLTKANRDLDTAFLNHRNNGYPDVTCYFCHQAAEKALKSYLLFRGSKTLPRIHSLPDLQLLCVKEDKSFLELAENCSTLNGYYIESKYPVSPIPDYPVNEANRAIILAEELLKFVSHKVKRSS